MKGNTSKRKIIIAVSAIALVLVAAIVSVVAVFAATTQTVQSSVNVTYRVTDVSATVTAKFARAGAKSGDVDASGNKLFVDAGSHTFNAEDSTDVESLDLSSNLPLTSTDNYVIYEFGFENNSTLGFTASLTAIPATTFKNMTLSYYVSDTKVADDEISAISADKFAAFAVADEEGNVTTAYPAAEGNYTVTTAVGGGVDEVSYIYIKAKINNLNSQADLVGSFEWDLTAAS